jgi:hypothetical protein
MLKLRLLVLAVLLGVMSTMCLAQAAPASSPDTSKSDKKANKKASNGQYMPEADAVKAARSEGIAGGQKR